jgi:hypothetical protein
VLRVWVVNIQSGRVVAFVRFEDALQEIFAVQAVPFRQPDVLNDDAVRLAESLVVPGESLAEVAEPFRRPACAAALEAGAGCGRWSLRRTGHRPAQVVARYESSWGDHPRGVWPSRARRLSSEEDCQGSPATCFTRPATSCLLPLARWNGCPVCVGDVQRRRANARLANASFAGAVLETLPGLRRSHCCARRSAPRMAVRSR